MATNPVAAPWGAMTELLLRPLSDAFLDVGVFVALMVVPFGWAQHRWGHRMDALLLRHRRLGPLVAALLTVPPGCGGAIVVMSVYARGAASYGAAIAALVATMGDVSWVLLAAEPVFTLQLKLLLVVAGTVTGGVVDAVGITPRRRVPALDPALVGAGPAPLPPPVARSAALPDAAPVPTRVPTRVLPRVLWVLLAAGGVVSLAALAGASPRALGPDVPLLLGAAGTLVAIAMFAVARGRPTYVGPGGFLVSGAQEVAFVTVWVAVAYVAWSVLTRTTGFDGSQLPLMGLVGVVVGVAVGLIPGCAVQLVFAGLFLAGGMPVATFVANTVSQDGDALIPLLALEHRSALLATVITCVPALSIGVALHLLT